MISWFTDFVPILPTTYEQIHILHTCSVTKGTVCVTFKFLESFIRNLVWDTVLRKWILELHSSEFMWKLGLGDRMEYRCVQQSTVININPTYDPNENLIMHLSVTTNSQQLALLAC